MMKEIKKTKKMFELEERLGEDLGEYLRREYEEKGKSPYRIAEDLDTKPNNIRRWLKYNNVKTRGYSEARLPVGVTRPSKEQLEKLYNKEKMTLEQIAKKIGASKSCVYTWIKEEEIKLRNAAEYRLPEGFVPPTEEQLKGYIKEGKNINEIGNDLGVSKSVICRLLKKYEIKIKGNFDNPIQEQIKKMYIEEQKSSYQIAEELGISDSTIYRLLKKMGVKIRSMSEAKLSGDVTKPNKEELERLYNKKRMSTKQIAEMLGIDKSTVGDWLRKSGIKIRTASEARLPTDVVLPTREQLEEWYNKEKKTTVQIAKDLGLSQSTIGRLLKKYNIPTRKSYSYFIRTSKEFVEFVKQDTTARNLAAAAIRLNGQARDVEQIITEVYEGKFKDRSQLHDYIQETKNEINDLIRDGLTNLGVYLGNFSLQERKIFPVLMGEIIASISEGTVASLEDKFIRLLRHDYGARFNFEPEKTLSELKEKINSFNGRKRSLYEKLEKHYQDVLKLKKELTS